MGGMELYHSINSLRGARLTGGISTVKKEKERELRTKSDLFLFIMDYSCIQRGVVP